MCFENIYLPSAAWRVKYPGHEYQVTCKLRDRALQWDPEASLTCRFDIRSNIWRRYDEIHCTDSQPTHGTRKRAMDTFLFCFSRVWFMTTEKSAGAFHFGRSPLVTHEQHNKPNKPHGSVTEENSLEWKRSELKDPRSELQENGLNLKEHDLASIHMKTS